VSSLDLIIDEARALVASGSAPDRAALAARIRDAAPDDDVATAAMNRLDRVLSIQRARASLKEKPKAPPPPAPVPRRAAYRARPTLTGNMDVRRRPDFSLEWDAAPAVVAWEVRLSERPDARSEYTERETLQPSATAVELPLGELPLRVHVLGRDRGGRLIRRAVVSGLTKESWNDRWQRRASAS
jgi:hypothetical protein